MRRVTVFIAFVTLACNAERPPAARKAIVVKPQFELAGIRFGERFAKKAKALDCSDTPKNGAPGDLLCFDKDTKGWASLSPIMVHRTYLDSALILLSIELMGDDYDRLLAALSTKYGKPDTTLYPSTNVSGYGSVTYPKNIWQFADGDVSLTNGVGGNGFALLVARSTVGGAEFVRRDSLARARVKAEEASALLKAIGEPSR